MTPEAPFEDVVDAHEFQAREKGAFENETLYGLLIGAARYWVIEYFIRTGKLPHPDTFYAYANGPTGFNWGDPPGPAGDGSDQNRPLHGKRVVIRLSIEDE